jgi:hypothetical protein
MNSNKIEHLKAAKRDILEALEVSARVLEADREIGLPPSPVVRESAANLIMEFERINSALEELGQ